MPDALVSRYTDICLDVGKMFEIACFPKKALNLPAEVLLELLDL